MIATLTPISSEMYTKDPNIP
jgi:hypothetical protein